MPVRVLDRHGRGQADEIAKGIRFAVDHGADVINMSFNFGCGKKVPEVDAALAAGLSQKGVVTVASVGNLGSEACVSPPATDPARDRRRRHDRGSLPRQLLAGRRRTRRASRPGGGTPTAGCPSVSAGPIYQVTLKARQHHATSASPSDYVGTSMAAAHVSGVAAMILASGVIGPKATPQGRGARRDAGG